MDAENIFELHEVQADLDVREQNSSLAAVPTSTQSGFATQLQGTASATTRKGTCTTKGGYANSRFPRDARELYIENASACMQVCQSDGDCNCWTFKEDGFCRIGQVAPGSCKYVGSSDDKRWSFGSCEVTAGHSSAKQTPAKRIGFRPVPSQTAHRLVAHRSQFAPDISPKAARHTQGLAEGDLLPIVVMACCREAYLERSLKSYLAVRPNASTFPMWVSQDSSDAGVADLLRRYLDNGQIDRHWRFQPDLAPGKAHYPSLYHRLASHYKFALDKVFAEESANQVVILEDDLEVSPDFYGYFQATLPLLKADPQLFCISAWNDNGKATLATDPRALLRSDFFPGLGWMMLSSFWTEVRGKWPAAYWDDFLRGAEIRQGRQCIRPEVGRTITFGEKGASGGQFFNTHLVKIVLNTEHVDWASEDLSYVATAENFDAYLSAKVIKASTTRPNQLFARLSGSGPSLVVPYSLESYRSIARRFGLMEDEKDGIRRGSYRGVITFTWKTFRTPRRIYLVRDWPLCPGAADSAPSLPTSHLQQQGECKTLILTTYFTQVLDWQHPDEHKRPDPSKLNAFRNSLLGAPGVQSVILHDALPEAFVKENRRTGKLEFERVNLTNYDQYLGCNDVRFPVFTDWLRLHPEHEVVFTTDLFDVEVLQNPCILVSQAPDRLYVGSEQENPFGCDFLRERFDLMGGQYRVWYEDMSHRDSQATMFNAGIIGGGRHIFMSFLEAVTRVLEDPALQIRLLKRQVNVNMAAVNYAIRSNETLLSKVFTGHPLHSEFKTYLAMPCDIFKHKL